MCILTGVEGTKNSRENYKLQRLEFLPVQVKQTSKEKQTRARVQKSNKSGGSRKLSRSK
jgi:hypothetical protein